MKKGMSELISWVLLIGLAVTLTIIVGKYMMQGAEEQAAQTVSFVETGILCEKLVISVENLTADTRGYIKEISIKNRGYLAIDGIMIRGYYKREQPLNVQKTLDNKLNPNEEIAVAISPPIYPGGIEKLEILPLKEKEGCASRKETLDCERIKDILNIDISC